MSDQAEEHWLTYREPARVQVSEGLGVRGRATHVAAQCVAPLSGSVRPDVQVHEQAVEALREQLAIANSRAERAERRIDELIEDRRREAEERRKLLGLLTDPRAPWWRRWFR
jgi:hypothetical protein